MSCKVSWEPGEVVRGLNHLDGSVLSIDQLSMSHAPKQLQDTAKDVDLRNLDRLDRQSFKGTTRNTINNPFIADASLQKRVYIRTGETINPDLDIAPAGSYTIKADPRPLSLHESQPSSPLHAGHVYGPDGRALGKCYDSSKAHHPLQVLSGFSNPILNQGLSKRTAFPEL